MILTQKPNLAIPLWTLKVKGQKTALFTESPLKKYSKRKFSLKWTKSLREQVKIGIEISQNQGLISTYK
jgi:hypothetical protein